MTVWSGWDWSTSISVFRIMWWHELTMSAGQKRTYETRSWVWSSHPTLATVEKHMQRISGKQEKTSTKEIVPCGPCLMTTTKAYANTWEPVERDQIESCKSAPVAVEARRKHGSETKALLQVLSKDQKDQPVFTVFSFQKLYWSVLKTETFRIKIQMFLTCTLPTIKSRWVGDTGDTPQPSPFFRSSSVSGIRVHKVCSQQMGSAWLSDSCWTSFYLFIDDVLGLKFNTRQSEKGATGLFVFFSIQSKATLLLCHLLFSWKKTHQRETTFHPLFGAPSFASSCRTSH